MSIDAAIISLVLKKPTYLRDLQRAGVTDDYFVGDAAKIYRYICRTKKEYGKVPSTHVAQVRFPDLEIQKVRERDLPVLLADLQKRRKYMDFLNALDEATQEATSPDDVEDTLAILQRRLNSIATTNGKSGIVDLFSEDVRKRMLRDIKKRREGTVIGIPTGLRRFDYVTGGLQKGRMVTIIGRPGIGKSFLNLLFVASAVTHGSKVVLYPLEMTLEETALRLYTIFSQKMFGPNKVIKNLDLSLGRATPKQVVKLLNALEDRYKGQLLVADTSTMSDSYTVERINAEVQAYKPDMFWVDYLTLMRATGMERGAKEYTGVQVLANGIKRAAQASKCIGGCSAQVNREAMKARAFIPRLENIAFGDSIGMASDQVISINRKDKHLYYGLVKNRHGPEIGRVRVQWEVDDGIIKEDEHQPEDEDDE